MISYDIFWETLKRKGISQYRLIKDFGISSSVFARMRKNDYLGLRKIEDLCKALKCEISDIVRYVEEKTE